MFKNVIHSKRKRYIIDVRVLSIFVLACSFDLICGQKHCGFYFHRNLALRLRPNPTFRVIINTTTMDPLMAELYRIIERTDPPSDEVNTTIRTKSTKMTANSRKKALKTKSVTLKVPLPTLVRNKWIRTQWVRIPKRRWYKYNASLTTPYDINAFRRAKRRKHREELKAQKLIRIERRKIPKTPRVRTGNITRYLPDLFLRWEDVPGNSRTTSNKTKAYYETTTQMGRRTRVVTQSTKSRKRLKKELKLEKRKRKRLMEAIASKKEEDLRLGSTIDALIYESTIGYTKIPKVTIEGAEATTQDIWQRIHDKKKGGKIGGKKRKIFHDDPAAKQKYVRDKAAQRERKKNKHPKKAQVPKKRRKDGVVNKS